MRVRASFEMVCLIVVLSCPRFLYAADQASAASKCVECHEKVTPNIVSDWKLSKHSQAEITCADCHGGEHTSVNDVAKVKMPTSFTEVCSPP